MGRGKGALLQCVRKKRRGRVRLYIFNVDVCVSRYIFSFSWVHFLSLRDRLTRQLVKKNARDTHESLEKRPLVGEITRGRLSYHPRKVSKGSALLFPVTCVYSCFDPAQTTCVSLHAIPDRHQSLGAPGNPLRALKLHMWCKTHVHSPGTIWNTRGG